MKIRILNDGDYVSWGDVAFPIENVEATCECHTDDETDRLYYVSKKELSRVGGEDNSWLNNSSQKFSFLEEMVEEM